MNSQEVFDFVVNHLRLQNAKSVEDVEEGRCLYRGPEGRKCAVGCLIPDKNYSPYMEGRNIIAIACEGTLSYETQKLFVEHGNLLFGLQQVHDHSPIEEWESKFQLIAQKNRLIYTPPETNS